MQRINTDNVFEHFQSISCIAQAPSALTFFTFRAFFIIFRLRLIASFHCKTPGALDIYSIYICFFRSLNIIVFKYIPHNCRFGSYPSIRVYFLLFLLFTKIVQCIFAASVYMTRGQFLCASTKQKQQKKCGKKKKKTAVHSSSKSFALVTVRVNRSNKYTRGWINHSIELSFALTVVVTVVTGPRRDYENMRKCST